MAKTNSSVSKSGKSAEIAQQEAVVKSKREEIASNEAILRQADEIVEKYEKELKLKRQLTEEAKDQLKAAKEIQKQAEQRQASYKAEQKALSRLYETENKRKKLLRESIADADEFASALRSLGVQVGKDNKLFEAMNSHIDSVATTLNTVGQITAQLGDDQQNLKKQVINSADAYKNLNTNITVAGKKLMQQKTTQSEYNQLIKESYENLDEAISKIDQSTAAGKDLFKIMTASKKEMESFYKAAEKSEQVLQGMNTGLDQIASSGVPAVSELSNVIKTAAQGGKGLSLALFSLGAALGALAYNMGMIGDKVGTTASFDKDIIGTTGKIDVLEKKIAQGALGGRNFVVEKAMAQFNASMRQASASFQAASKTALFGNKIGGVGYGAAQLQMAGISADKIASGMTAAADATGQMPTAKIGADMAIMASRTGQSEESIASINESYMRMDGLTADTALNMQEGLRAMSEQANVNLGGVVAEMANASKDMLGYQIKSTSALAKQVIFAKSMGVSFNEVAKAGQSMVLNYKDSIKSEMQLSAMLGKNVDLSEVRAQFAAGNTDKALEALKAQGLDPAKMDMFQQQMLQQTTGMDLTALSKINQNTGKNVGTATGNATAGNKSFLNRTVSAQATLEATNAMISSDTAIKMSELDTQEQQQLQDAIMKNTGGIKDLKNTLTQQEALKDATLGLTTAIFGLISGILSLAAGPLFKGGLSGFKDMLMGPKPGQGGNALWNETKYTKNAAGRYIDPTTKRFVSNKAVADAKANNQMGGMTRGAKIGGSVLAGAAGAVQGYQNFNAVREGETETRTTDKMGAGLVQGGLAAAGTALGMAFGGPLGGMIGGFLGDSVGGWLNENAPGIAQGVGDVFSGIMSTFNEVWTSLTSAFTGLWDSLAPIRDLFGSLAKKLGFGDGGMGSILSGVGKVLGWAVIWPLKLVGLVAEGIAGFINLLMKGYNAFADTWIGKKLGLSPAKMADTKAAQPTAAAPAAPGGKGADTSVKASAAAKTSVATVGDNYSGKVELGESGTKSIVAALAGSSKWTQDKMTYMSGNLEKVVTRTEQTANNTAASLQQIKVLNTNTLAMKELTRRIEALTRATYEGGTVVKIDGKTIATAVERYESNTFGTDPASITPISRGSKTTVG